MSMPIPHWNQYCKDAKEWIRETANSWKDLHEHPLFEVGVLLQLIGEYVWPIDFCAVVLRDDTFERVIAEDRAVPFRSLSAQQILTSYFSFLRVCKLRWLSLLPSDVSSINRTFKPMRFTVRLGGGRERPGILWWGKMPLKDQSSGLTHYGCYSYVPFLIRMRPFNQNTYTLVHTIRLTTDSTGAKHPTTFLTIFNASIEWTKPSDYYEMLYLVFDRQENRNAKSYQFIPCGKGIDQQPLTWTDEYYNAIKNGWDILRSSFSDAPKGITLRFADSPFEDSPEMPLSALQIEM